MADNIVQNDTQLLLQLVQLLVEDKRADAEDRKAKRARQEVLDKSARQTSDAKEEQQKKREQYCTHLKNQPSKHYKSAASIRIDYAVSHHTFPDGNTYIRCLICGAKWHRGDTQETWTKKGVKVPNWTGLGWQDAVKMVAASTNTATASETVVVQPSQSVLQK